MPDSLRLLRLQSNGHPRTALVVLVAVALLLGLWGAWRSFGPVPPNARERLQLQAGRIDWLEQRNANLERSDQISRQANAGLQATLAERDEEIAGLRADLAFYERFIGTQAPRRGLTVHALALAAQTDPQRWHFVATLTQSLQHGTPSRGRLTLALEVSDGRRLRRLDWDALRQASDPAGIAYAFKYFQQVEGELLLPPGLRPVRLRVRLQPADGKPVDAEFAWAEAVASAGG